MHGCIQYFFDLINFEELRRLTPSGLLLHCFELLAQILLQALQSRIYKLLLGLEVARQIGEIVIYPDLVIVGHSTRLKQVKRLGRLDQLHPQHLCLCLSRIVLFLKTGHVVYEHSKLAVYAN